MKIGELILLVWFGAMIGLLANSCHKSCSDSSAAIYTE